MQLISTMGWGHVAINRKGLRDIWFMDNSDFYIIYLDNSKEPETCRVVRMYNEPEGVISGAYTLEKEDAEAFIKKLGDGRGFFDRNINFTEEHKDAVFHLNEVMERIFLAMEYYQGQRRN
ncbi:hypothetical protein KY310_00670 [Candidatus Woesearchaeota archaeon]|nr:hypothetical protein [Candidatus Woesearchaeota archaeon]